MLRHVIEKQRCVFSPSPDKCNVFQYDVDIDEPLMKRTYPILLCHRNQVTAQIKMWFECGIIESTISKHHHPLVVVRKKDIYEVRICLDLQELNRHVPLIKWMLNLFIFSNHIFRLNFQRNVETNVEPVNMTVNLRKWCFLTNKISFLGFSINLKDISNDSNTVETIPRLLVLNLYSIFWVLLIGARN